MRQENDLREIVNTSWFLGRVRRASIRGRSSSEFAFRRFLAAHSNLLFSCETHASLHRVNAR